MGIWYVWIVSGLQEALYGEEVYFKRVDKQTVNSKVHPFSTLLRGAATQISMYQVTLITW